ncbi:MAG: SdrD B-like domain-containing protein [Limnobacter sp.]|uniref:SdrD B-like domain-containing protein n=1 Tax=Limnobacter sp. TaxID=2003368 RepID=UPI0032EAD534
MNRYLMILLAWFSMFSAASAVFAASTVSPLPAGGTVLNQASLYYIDNATGLPSNLASNPVRALMQQYEAGLLLVDQRQRRAAGNLVTLKHRLVNTGNAMTEYSLRLEKHANDQFDIDSLWLVHDLNGNGEMDSGEPAVTSIELFPGQSAGLVISGKVPIDASGISKIDVVAYRAEVEFARNTDTVEVTAGAVLALSLEASTLTPERGELVELVLNAQNVGNAVAGGIAYEVDGSVESGLLIVQEIAPNTLFLGASAKVGRVLYKTGNDYGFSATAPSDLSSVSAVAYVLEKLVTTADAEFKLTVQANHNSSGEMPYRSEAHYNNAVVADNSRSSSNQVVLLLEPSPPEVTYYSDPSFSVPAAATRLGAPLYLQADASACNSNTSLADEVVITIRSELSGDEERFLGVEQGINTGIFRIPQAIETTSMLSSNMVPGNGVVETGKNDRLIATIGDCGVGEAFTSVLIDPEGVVFDSRNNLPVANVRVELIDVDGRGNGGNPGGPAVVFQDDGTTPAPNRVITGADGSYRFPLVPASTYRLLVTPPTGYEFSSSLAPGVLPAGRSIDLSGSYGGNFAVNTFTGAVKIDVPLDNVNATGIQIKKTVARKIVEIGDIVSYAVEVRNISGEKLFGVVLRDQLPPGFQYRAGSAVREGQKINDPEGSTTSVLAFPLGTLENDESATIAYVTAVGIGARIGTNAINRAQAQSASPLAHTSNVATASVRVEGGVFDTHGFVLGKVYADCNEDGLQQEGEKGVPGVRVWLENGNWATSDHHGLFSFHGVTPQTHVAKVDATTLPANTRTLAISNRHAGDGNSRFIDMKNGELHRADFALQGCPNHLDQEIDRRVQKIKIQTRPASLEPAHKQIEKTPARTVKSLAESVDTLNNSLDFIDMEKTLTVATTQTGIRIKGPIGANLVLKVNGVDVPYRKMGTRVEVAGQKMEAREYIGLELKPGENRVELLDVDANGRVKARKSIQLMAPGALFAIHIDAGQPAIAGQGQTAQVEVSLFDAAGIPVVARTALNLFSDSGSWLHPDLDPVATGHQVFVEGGHAVFRLQSPEQTGRATVQITSGMVKAESEVTFLAQLREMIAVGLLEGVINLRELRKGILSTGNGNDGFEQEIQHFSTQGNGVDAGARAALFLKGKIRGNYLLTMAYDSDKPTQDKLFRDIDPDQYYPVYGDDSVKGSDAQSNGRLYLRLDKNKSWFLLGDFNTQSADRQVVRKLSAYNRSLNGVRHHYDADNIQIDSFASRETTRQVVEEIPANGTSGPYALKFDNLVANSEKIEIVTRDSDQPAVVIGSVAMQRFVDYTLEPFSGRILFRAPVASLDENLNEQFVRVTYEVQQDGEEFWVAGAEVRVDVLEDVQVGAAIVDDQNPQDPSKLRGVFARYESGNTSIVGELASSNRLSVGSGNAARVEGKIREGRLQGRFQVSRSDPAFSNASSTLSRGRTEARGKFNYSLDDKNRLIVDLLSSKDALTGRTKRGLFLAAERNFANNVKVQLGVRSESFDSPAQGASLRTGSHENTNSVTARIDGPAPIFPKVSLYGEVEQAVGNSKNRLVAVGGEYRLAGKGRVYGRHELSSSLGGSFQPDNEDRRNTSVLGVDSEYMKNGRAFSEYRARQVFSEREVEAAIGLRNRIPVSETLSFNTSFERVKAITCKTCIESIATTGAVSYSPNINTKATGRLELRKATNGRSVLSSQGLAHRISEQWTILTRNIFLLNHSGRQRRLQDRFQIGVAFRNIKTNLWNALGRYEFKTDKTLTAGAVTQPGDYRRQVHVFSTHANVKVSRPLVATLRYAGKFGKERYSGIGHRTRGQLVSGRMTYDLTPRWDLGLQGSVLLSNDASGRRTACGAEVGYLLQENQWVSAGYNAFGFKDRDLSGQDTFSKGFYLRLRVKFDEQLFARF